MQYGKTGIIITLTSLLMAGSALAQDAAPENRRDMTPEQREAARAEHRERWENMSDEERTAAREKHRDAKKARRVEHRERWENMSSTIVKVASVDREARLLTEQ